jgi:hypothetical protein
MSDTIQEIKRAGEALIRRVMDGETLSKDDHAVLKIYNSLYSGKAGNAGKRKNPNIPRKQKP